MNLSIPKNHRITHVAISVFFVFLSLNSFTQQSWIEVPTPEVSQTRNMLRDIGGTSSSDVWTVGSYETATPGNMKNLIMHWNGSSWQTFGGTDQSNTLSDLWGVTAISSNDVWAAGSHNIGADTRAQLMHWNGSSWTHTTLPVITGGSYLDGIDAISSNDIWAVGGKAGSPTRPAYAIHYNGSTWTDVNVPNIGTFRNTLYDVDGIASNDVWAVGHFGNSYGDFHAMAQHWNGSNWSNSPLPSSVNTPIGELYNVTMIASNDVWAVGSTITGDMLLIHWNGSNWSTVPTAGSTGGSIATSNENIYAVGSRISQYVGNNWTVIDSLNQIPYPSLVSTVTFSNGDVWAAGISWDEGFYTLVYRTQQSPPLAVELREYTITKINHKAVMKWSTASEINADHFVMERSNDGIHFIPLDQVPASGGPHTYQLTDVSPLPGNNYYRLKLIDIDGTVTLFPIKSLRFDKNDQQLFSVYPNPVQGGVLNVSFHGEGERSLILFDQAGKEIQKWNVSGEETARTYHLADGVNSGIYILSLRDVNGIYSEKIFIE